MYLYKENVHKKLITKNKSVWRCNTLTNQNKMYYKENVQKTYILVKNDQSSIISLPIVGPAAKIQISGQNLKSFAILKVFWEVLKRSQIVHHLELKSWRERKGAPVREVPILTILPFFRSPGYWSATFQSYLNHGTI